MSPLALLLLYLIAVHAKDIDDDVCHECIKVENSCYNVTFVANLPANFRKHVIIHSMDVRHSDNTLFYVYEPSISDPEYYKVAYINLEDLNNAGILQEGNKTNNFGTFAIDNQSVVYLGGVNGIYSYQGSILNRYSNYDHEIVSLFFKNKLYISRANETSIKAKDGPIFDYVLDANQTVKFFAVYNETCFIFSSRLGLFLVSDGRMVKLSNNAYFRGLTADLEGDIYAWWVDGIYKVNISGSLGKSTIDKIADLPNVGAITFDNMDNILFTIDKELFRLTPTVNGTIC